MYPFARKSMRFALLLFADAVLATANAAAQLPAHRDWFALPGNGTFSRAAQNMCETVARTPPDLFIRSPNGKITVVTRATAEDAKTFAVDAAGRTFPITSEGWPCPEIGWSASSDRFFVTYSDGGAIGSYHVAAYALANGKLTELPVAADVSRDFLTRYPKCFRPETPNVAGIAWSRDASRLLVAAEVLPHSNCDEMGTFRVYEVAVPGGKIVRRYSQIEAKKLFRRLLGPELRNADDSCFSHPGACAIPMLHDAK